MEHTFESAMKRLEEISKILADNNVTLDESVELYAEGVKLISFCSSKLENAKLQISKIDGTVFEEKQ